MVKVTTKYIAKRKLIRLKRIGTSWREMTAFGQLLIRNLGDEIFTFQSMQTILFHVLSQISPINRWLNRDEIAIEKACGIVLKHFGIDKDKPLHLRTAAGDAIDIKPKSKTNSTKFCEQIIEMDKVPGQVYQQLINEVNNDLLSISEIIQWYETQPCVEKYIKDKDNPRNHEDRKYVDFYNRCVTERIEILNYQLYGLKLRALSKSKKTDGWSRSIMDFEWYHDRPYHFARPYAIRYFDCRRIDLVDHRLADFLLPDAKLMEELYYRNKSQFYRKYFKKITVPQLFQEIRFHLDHLPLKNDRKIIFKELERLYKSHRWISFYALALPQVEGLFSEMYSAVTPGVKSLQKALTDKVNTVRKFHKFNTYYFDYYQYHIPVQRNRFSHTGYDEDFKLKSCDLLVDLAHLLKVFSELDNPLVKIKQLHVRKNYEDFITIKDLVDYFQLLNELKSPQKEETQPEILKFEAEFLSQECNVEYNCYLLLPIL